MAVEITEEFVWQSIPPRARDSHKGCLLYTSDAADEL